MEVPIPTLNPEKYEFLKRFVQIDPIDIDEEVATMSTLIQDCGECASLAVEMKDQAKEALETAKAEACEALRSTPTEKGKERTETAISTQYQLDKNYQEKQELLREARYNAALWTTLQSSLQSKSYSLRVVADLIQSGFLTRDYIVEKRRKEIREAKA